MSLHRQTHSQIPAPFLENHLNVRLAIKIFQLFLLPFIHPLLYIRLKTIAGRAIKHFPCHISR